MRCAFFYDYNSLGKGASGVKNLVYTINEVYQVIATGGLLATVFTLLSEQCGYRVPGLMQLALLFAAGLLSLAIATYKKLDKNGELWLPTPTAAVEVPL